MVYLLLVNGVDVSPWWLFVERDAGKKCAIRVRHVGNLVDFLLEWLAWLSGMRVTAVLSSPI